MGDYCAQFESKLAAFLRAGHMVVCSSGTTALHLALAALRIGPGDEVLVPNVTFIAPVNAVRYCGATPVLVDIDAATLALSLRHAVNRLSQRTKAIIVVHLFGEPATMRDYCDFAAKHNLLLLEDAAEGFGAEVPGHGRYMGTVADIGTFSFYGNKIISTGEGGACATSSAAIAERMRHLRGQAQTKQRYQHDEVGYNYRLTDVQAAFGLAQLETLETKLAHRLRVINRYRRNLQPLNVWMTTKFAAPWQFTIMLPPGIDRAELSVHMMERRIDTRPCFVPMNQLLPYRDDSSEFPVSKELAARALMLPTYPELSDEQVDFVSATMLRYCQRAA
jgi:perosamine synthetase